MTNHEADPSRGAGAGDRDGLSAINDVDNDQEDLMETTGETTTVWTTKAGDRNAQITLQMPPEAMELAYEHAAREFAAALGELDRVVGDKRAGALDVAELFDVQSELERASLAVDALFKARPAEEWEEARDDG